MNANGMLSRYIGIISESMEYLLSPPLRSIPTIITTPVISNGSIKEREKRALTAMLLDFGDILYRLIINGDEITSKTPIKRPMIRMYEIIFMPHL